MIATFFFASALAMASALAPAVKQPVQSTSAAATQAAPVLIRNVERGEILSKTDFTSDEISKAIARNALAPEAASGLQAVRNLTAGMPVKATDVMSPPLVRRGENVTISLVTGSLTITSAGRALSNAGKGESVRVLNIATNRTVDAIAENSGDVRIYAQ